jgi:hypothetical protein
LATPSQGRQIHTLGGRFGSPPSFYGENRTGRGVPL